MFMKSQLRYILGGGAKLVALSILFINSAIADSTTDARIQAYKANKLIPQNVVLPTSTGAADSDEVVVFNKSALSWKSDNALSASYAPLLEKYGDMTIDELRTAMGPSGTFNFADGWVETGWLTAVSPEQQELREYLSLVANNKLQADNLTQLEARTYLQEQFDAIINLRENIGEGSFGAFPCEGIDFSNKNLNYADLSLCTGITGEQITSSEFTGAKLPTITFTGNESFQNKDITETDLSKCTGVTAEQIMSTTRFTGAKLPAITFTGNESFTGRDLYYVDISQCTGITAEQISTVSDITGMHITSSQHNAWKSTLNSQFSPYFLFIDGVEFSSE